MHSAWTESRNGERQPYCIPSTLVVGQSGDTQQFWSFNIVDYMAWNKTVFECFGSVILGANRGLIVIWFSFTNRKYKNITPFEEAGELLFPTTLLT